jgi:hypothetical protein
LGAVAVRHFFSRHKLIKQYKEETSKLSDEIFRDKRPELEND